MVAFRVPDKLDERILAELRQDARRSFREIARRVGSTTPTVSARVRRMEESGLIAGYEVRLRGARRAKPTAWTCDVCHGSIRGRARVRRVAGRHRAFCCRGCEARFVERWTRLQKRAGA